MATTEGGEALFADASDPSTALYYDSIAKLTDASDADRGALTDAYVAILGMVKTSNKLMKVEVAKVRGQYTVAPEPNTGGVTPRQCPRAAAV